MSSVAYPNAQAIFYQQYEAVRRDEVVGILLALFLGTFGIHHFYLRRTGLGDSLLLLFLDRYSCLSRFLECFFMPGRVREFNAIQAAGIAAALGIDAAHGLAGECDRADAPRVRNWDTDRRTVQRSSPAAAANAPIRPGARFCSGCGTAL